MKSLFAIFALLFASVAHSQTTIILPQEITATGQAGSVVDTATLKGQGQFILTGKSTSGSSPTLAVKLQSSPALAVGSNVALGTTGGTSLRTGTNDNIKLASKFTVAAAKNAKTVILPLKKGASLASGTLTLSIQANSTADPSGTALGTATLDLSTLTTSYTSATFTFTNPVDLAIGTYWLVLEGDYTVHATNNVTWRSSAIASAGNANVYDSAWSADATLNLDHAIYQYAFADVTGGAFTGLTTTGVIESKEIPLGNLGVIRAYATIGGTSTPKFATSLLVLEK